MREKKKHLLVISQYFYPEQFRINDICKEWVKRGYEVTVVTGVPNYPEGKYYKGYAWYGGKEEYEGIHIIRLPLIQRGKTSLMLMLNYASFVLSGRIWGLITRIKADQVFIFEVSPMTQALVGVWYAKRRHIPCFLYVQDLWPENVEIVTGIHSAAILKSIEKMVNYIYKHCDRIFATSPGFVKRIQKRCQDKGKVTYWPQYAEDFYQPIEKKKAKDSVSEIPQDDRFKIIFTGNIGQAQGLEILPRVAIEMKKTSIYKKVLFIIVGNGRDKENLKKQIEQNNVKDMFIMIDRQSSEYIPYLLACCDAAFLSFMDNELFMETIPAKLQSYMACGMPIIASVVGEAEKIIKEAECGFCCPLGDAKMLASKIKEIVNSDIEVRYKMGENSRIYFERNFLKKALMDEMDEAFL